MTEEKVNLLHLPNEMLLMILRKLSNVEVLYSLLGMKNQRLELLAQQDVFTNVLNFANMPELTAEFRESILIQFCASILPRIHVNVQTLIVDSLSMECLLHAIDYPNLTELKIFNVNHTIMSRLFINDSLRRHHFNEQITDLLIHINENDDEITFKEYTKNIYANLFVFFPNLIALSVQSAMDNACPPLALNFVPSTTCSSSTLTKISINVYFLTDVYAIPDGHLKQLTTLIVKVDCILKSALNSAERIDLSNLKCFSLQCSTMTYGYQAQALPLLRQLSNVEDLTLYLYICATSAVVNGVHLEKEIVHYTPRLLNLKFYLAFENEINEHDVDLQIYHHEIQRSFLQMKHGQVKCLVGYAGRSKLVCDTFSIPFQFTFLQRIGNNIGDVRFNSVTYLKLWGKDEFRYEFFVRLAQCFPSVQKLCIWNKLPIYWRPHELSQREKYWRSIIEYPNLVSINFEDAHPHYVDIFLEERKTYSPRLVEVKVACYSLESVTEIFTKIETRRTFLKIKRLFFDDPVVYPKEFHNYFPLLTPS